MDCAGFSIDQLLLKEHKPSLTEQEGEEVETEQVAEGDDAEDEMDALSPQTSLFSDSPSPASPSAEASCSAPNRRAAANCSTVPNLPVGFNPLHLMNLHSALHPALAQQMAAALGQGLARSMGSACAPQQAVQSGAARPAPPKCTPPVQVSGAVGQCMPSGVPTADWSSAMAYMHLAARQMPGMAPSPSWAADARQLAWVQSLVQKAQHKRKGGQIRFTNEQTDALEETFDANKYLTNAQRRKLAKQLALSERQVKTWFQNRRAKWRRVRKDGEDEEDVTGGAQRTGAGAGRGAEQEQAPPPPPHPELHPHLFPAGLLKLFEQTAPVNRPLS